MSMIESQARKPGTRPIPAETLAFINPKFHDDGVQDRSSSAKSSG
jgi:hypothetical protein